MTIIENFLPSEHSMMLKKLGFNEQCLYFYRGQKQYNAHNYNTEVTDNNECSAVLWAQAESWLWEQHKISIECECVSVTTMMFKVRAYKFERGDAGLIQYLHFDSPIIGKMEGIKKAIEYLHELSDKDHLLASRIEDSDNKK